MQSNNCIVFKYLYSARLNNNAVPAFLASSPVFSSQAVVGRQRDRIAAVDRKTVQWPVTGHKARGPVRGHGLPRTPEECHSA